MSADADVVADDLHWSTKLVTPVHSYGNPRTFVREPPYIRTRVHSYGVHSYGGTFVRDPPYIRTGVTSFVDQCKYLGTIIDVKKTRPPIWNVKWKDYMLVAILLSVNVLNFHLMQRLCCSNLFAQIYIVHNSCMTVLNLWWISSEFIIIIVFVARWIYLNSAAPVRCSCIWMCLLLAK